jgi:ribosomal protein L11 methyltransferase
MEVNIFTKWESLPAVGNILQDIGAEGLVQKKLSKTEEALENGTDDDLLIKSYLPINESMEAKLAILKSRVAHLFNYDLNVGSGRIEFKKIPEEDWSSSWKKHFKPKKVSEGLVIKPTWEEYEAQAGERIIELDPGMAFGTGSHVTTTMCIEAIEKYKDEREDMLDIGTGTGILSIAANLVGIKDVLAIDIDEVAIKVARENLELNRIQAGVSVKKGNLIDMVERKYDLVVANLLPHIISDLLPNIKQVLHDDSILILSGINQGNKEKIKRKLEEYRLIVKEIKEEEEWVTIIGERGQ